MAKNKTNEYYSETLKGLMEMEQILKDKIADVRAAWVKSHSPLKKGDKLVIPNYSVYFAGRRAAVIAVHVVKSHIISKGSPITIGDFCWLVEVDLLRKDGTKGDNPSHCRFELPLDYKHEK